MQDSEEIRPSERIAAAQQWETLHQQLREEVAAQGIDPDTAAEVGGKTGSQAGGAASAANVLSSSVAVGPGLVEGAALQAAGQVAGVHEWSRGSWCKHAALGCYCKASSCPPFVASAAAR